MYLYCYRKRPNFGDDLNGYLWPRFIDVALTAEPSSDEVFVGIGTLLNERLPKARILHIVGSGLGYGQVTADKMLNWEVHFVRGPLTAKALSLDNDLAISDPAILLNRTEDLGRKKKFKCSFMPHHGIDSERYRNLCESVGLQYISPEAPCEVVITQILESEKLICSAMHGAIVAEAFRVPWLAVQTDHQILVSKWHDWAASLELDIEFTQLPAIYPQPEPTLKGGVIAWVKASLVQWQLQRLANSRKFQLGSDRILESRLKKMEERVRYFNAKYKNGIRQIAV